MRDLSDVVAKLAAKLKVDDEVEGHPIEDLEAREDARRRTRFLEALEIPARYAKYIGPDSPYFAIAQKLRFVGAEDWRAVVIGGDTGIGKSTVACEWLRQHVSAEPGTARFQPAPEMAGWSPWADDHLEIAKVKYLVIDDIGAAPTDPERDAVLRCLATRVAEERTTLLTTNLGARALTERYGPRFAERTRRVPITKRMIRD